MLNNDCTIKIEEISEENHSVSADENIIIGKAWTGDSNAKRALMLANVLPSTQYTINIPENNNIQQINVLQKPTRGSATIIKSEVLTFGTNIISTEKNAFCLILQFSNFDYDFTAEMFENYTISIIAGINIKTARDDVARSINHWKGKKLVWLGTSIPAAGKYQVNNPISYPIMVGNMLGATVYNEAVGSSALHCKDPVRISTSNPYGFLSNFEAVSRCITNSLTEMEWIIDHYNDSAVFTQNAPSTLFDTDKEFIRSCSWENKLQKYFNENDFPDAWIIDHGHNDVPSEYSESTYTEKYMISGTQHNGWYSNGTFIDSTASSYIEYDVSNELSVWINMTCGTGYDVYNLFDAEGNNIGYYTNSNEKAYNDFEVKTWNASTIRVSNPNNLIQTITVKKLKYPRYNSLYSYQGALDFIVYKILTYNPKARILMIGEYENQKFPNVSENQIIASKRWGFPIYKQWETLGWSQQPIFIDGEYKSMLNIIIPDNLHPHTDTTGYALKLMANNICGWLMTLSD